MEPDMAVEAQPAEPGHEPGEADAMPPWQGRRSMRRSLRFFYSPASFSHFDFYYLRSIC